MDIDELEKQLPDGCVWYLAKCHKDDMHGKHYAEMTIRVGDGVHMEFCYGDSAHEAMAGLVKKVTDKQ